MATYPFVKAYLQLGPRKGPVKAFLVHMAEGGGTVGYLAKPNPNNVSVHYVIERTGRIVQMVPESDASGSVNPRDIRTTDDADGFYGVTAAKAVMGDWHRDPNSAVISLEIEGYAKDGPNPTQSGALFRLVEDVRSRYPSIGLLGHRDFADYKACPGRLIAWDVLGGHGPASEDDTVVIVDRVPYQAPKQATGVNVQGWLPDGRSLKEAAWTGLVSADASVTRDDGKAPKGAGWVVGASRPFTGYLIPKGSLSITEPPPPVADCSDAVAAEHERTRQAAVAAVEAIR